MPNKEVLYGFKKKIIVSIPIIQDYNLVIQRNIVKKGTWDKINMTSAKSISMLMCLYDMWRS